MNDTFYQFLLEQTEKAGDKDFTAIEHLPEFFRVLTRLLSREISINDRHLINAALAYLVAPRDVIPEDIYGSRGYADDVFICAYVINELLIRHDDYLFADLWRHEEVTLVEACSESIAAAKAVFSDEKMVQRILDYAGL